MDRPRVQLQPYCLLLDFIFFIHNKKVIGFTLQDGSEISVSSSAKHLAHGRPVSIIVPFPFVLRTRKWIPLKSFHSLKDNCWDRKGVRLLSVADLDQVRKLPSPEALVCLGASYLIYVSLCFLICIMRIIVSTLLSLRKD